MPKSNSPIFTDWLTVSLRWIVLLGMLIAITLREPLSLALMGVLVAAAAWNIFLTGLAFLNRRLAGHRYVSIVSDMLVGSLLFLLSQGLGGNLAWSGILPLITTAIYFQIKGALIVSLINITGLSLYALNNAPLGEVAPVVLPLIPLYLGVSFIFGSLVQWVNQWLKASSESEVPSQFWVNPTERERRQIIYDLISSLSASLNYQRVLDAALDLSANALSALSPDVERLTSAALLFENQDRSLPELKIATARGFTSADFRLTVPGASGLVGRAIDEAIPQFSQDVLGDSELSRYSALHTCKAAYCIPLRTGLDICGVLLFAHPDRDFFTSDHREILDIAGKQVMIAIENASLYQNLEQEKERMMDIQEEARKKMARDLHDGPTQSVAAIAMRVNFARRLMDRDPKACAEELFRIEDLARRTTKEIRHMLFTLRPLVLESQGLIAALESMAEKMRETYDQNVIIEADARLINDLETNKQTVIFYIAEEAANNARKHARAAHIWVKLKRLEPDIILLAIEDDGVGFNPAAVDTSYEKRGSLGMVNMRERSELINGLLRIESAEGRGTSIQVLIPISEEAHDRLRRRQ